MAQETAPQGLQVLDPKVKREFAVPGKRINDGDDVSFFLTSTAYSDIMTWVLQLNASMFPRRSSQGPSLNGSIQSWMLDARNVHLSDTVKKLQQLLEHLDQAIEEAPPDTGPRRFGNVSFRKWYDIVEDRVGNLLEEFLPAEVLHFRSSSAEHSVTAKDELKAYLLGSFGSAQRLDYGTGHELSFLAFLGGIWKLGGFSKTQDGSEERAIVIGVIEPYLRLVRRLILTYTLEPAGSHGVWGLDDHSFIPYIFGSAQLSPAISNPQDLPSEGSLTGAPHPGDVAKATAVDRERQTSMYFSAIGFIYDVKKGPFWEHSRILFDVSGVPAGWAKINKGMLKMYDAEVLSKFPVVQHFPFGSLFQWEKDPAAVAARSTPHTASQPAGRTGMPSSGNQPLRNPMQESTKAPWAAGSGGAPRSGTTPMAPTAAPWATSNPSRAPQPLPGGVPTTRAPWASSGASQPPRPSAAQSEESRAMPSTKAPWAK